MFCSNVSPAIVVVFVRKFVRVGASREKHVQLIIQRRGRRHDSFSGVTNIQRSHEDGYASNANFAKG